MKRWDFDTDEDYMSYQSRREALPKSVTDSPKLLCKNLCTQLFA